MGNAQQTQGLASNASFNSDTIKGIGDDSIAVKQRHNQLLTTPQKAEA